ncbi:MAG: cysteine hydrolase [Phycisphaerales bacterium]|nr:cysteine hydrolase [Phycisphaerales bacterium]
MRQVMVVDMLEGFTREGPLASPRVDALVAKQAAFLRALPPESLVVFLSDAHSPDDFEFRRFPPHCLRGDRQARIRPELLEATKEAHARVEIVEKTTFSGFFRTRLDEVVSAAPSDEWIVIGCVTDCCVEANVAELTYRGKSVVVIRELVDTWHTSAIDAETHRLPAAFLHDATAINEEWFTRRLPAIWGARVVNGWAEAL